jgi:hypothetical protein
MKNRVSKIIFTAATILLFAPCAGKAKILRERAEAMPYTFTETDDYVIVPELGHSSLVDSVCYSPERIF